MANRTAATGYAAIVAPIAQRHGVPLPIANALFEHESRWNPRAVRNEPQINDASRGLGQLLLRTARSLGYSGTPDGLFDPAVNAELALRYLASQHRRGGTWEGALSAYNGGWRPDRGFGQVLTAPRSVVLAYDQATGQPARTFAAAVGQYANQPYVDAVLREARAFGWTGAAAAAPAATTGPAPLTAVLAPAAKPAPKPLAIAGAVTAGRAGLAAAVLAGLYALWRLFR